MVSASRAERPLGRLVFFTPTAMVTAQTMLAVPIITALVHRASERAWARYGDELISDGASRTRAIPQILSIIRAAAGSRKSGRFSSVRARIAGVPRPRRRP